MNHMIDDNRFVLIEKYKQRLVEGTNIESRPEEMAVLDSILFRFWQMGWLDKLEQSEAQERKGKWVPVLNHDYYACSYCGKYKGLQKNFCPNCGARMEVEHD